VLRCRAKKWPGCRPCRPLFSSVQRKRWCSQPRGSVRGSDHGESRTWQRGDPFVLGGGKKNRQLLEPKCVEGRVSHSASVRGSGGNSRSLLTNADDIQGVNEKYRGKTLCFWIWKGQKKRERKKKRKEDV